MGRYSQTEKSDYLKQKKAWDKKNKTSFITFAQWRGPKSKKKAKVYGQATKKKLEFKTTAGLKRAGLSKKEREKYLKD